MATGISEAIRKSMGLRREPSTIRVYAEFAERFARFTKKEQGFTEDDALAFIDHLISEGYSDSYVRWSYYALKRVYKATRSPFTMTLEDLPLGRREAVHRPVLSADEVASLIAFTRRCGSPSERFYLAMSTVYGLRRVELSRLTQESFREGTVRIETAKHGAPRTHLIPSEIQAVVREALQANALGYSISGLTAMFRELHHKAGLKRDGKIGWHSIRRSLDTCLLDLGLNYYHVRDFLRWRSAPGDMPALYHRANPASVDLEVFRVHPYVLHWR